MADPTIKVIIDAYTRGLEDGMRRSAQATENASKSMTARLADINQAAQLMQRTIQGTADIIGGIYDVGKEGAALADLETRFTRISGGSAQAAANLDAMRRATKNTVRDAELMERGLALLASGLAETDKDLESIMKTVPALGRQFKGFSADRAMLSYTMMISNGLQSVKMRADDFGISVTTVESRMKDLEAEGYATRDALQAAVNEEMLRVYNELGLSAETAATKMQQGETALQNFVDTAKKAFIPLSYEMASGLETIAGLFGETAEGVPILAGALFMMLAVLQGFLPTVEKLVLALVQLGHAFAALFSGDVAGAEEFFERAKQELSEIPEVAQKAINEAYRSYVEMYKGVEVATEETDEAIEELGETTDETAEKIQKLAEEVAKARQKLNERLAALDLRYARQAEDIAIRAARRQEDIAIQTARRREDMARQLAASIAQAQAQAALSAARAARDRAEALIDVERDYQKRLREIQRDYEMEASDAIRARDALALVRAREKRDKELTEAEEARQEARAEAERAYQEQLRQIQEALALQIQAALEAHRQQEEDLQRSLRRQEEDEALSARRREEDMQRSRMRAEMDARNAFAAYRAARLHEYAITEADFMAHLSRMQGAMSRMMYMGAAGMMGGYATGTPYVPQTGPYMLHQGEAVIPADQNPYRPGHRGQLTGGGLTLHQNFAFHGGFSAAEKQWFRHQAYQQALNAFNEVVG